MYDKELVRDILSQILEASQKMINFSGKINMFYDFTDSSKRMGKK